MSENVKKTLELPFSVQTDMKNLTKLLRYKTLLPLAKVKQSCRLYHMMEVGISPTLPSQWNTPLGSALC